jgi:hypothetical protein
VTAQLTAAERPPAATYGAIVERRASQEAERALLNAGGALALSVQPAGLDSGRSKSMRVTDRSG